MLFARVKYRLVPALLVGALALLPAACSSLKLAYDRLDWIVSYYVRDHVTLTDEQTERLEAALAATQRWHCANELAHYARWLRAVNDDIQAGRSGLDNVNLRYTEILGFWKKVTDQSADALATLLPQLSDEQIEEYLKNLARDNERLRVETVEPSFQQRQRRTMKTMRGHFDRWIGDLTTAQEQAVSVWVAAQGPRAAEDRLAMREAWRQELRQLLSQRHQPVPLRAGLRRLLSEPDALWPADYARYRAVRREQTLRLIESVGASLTAEQRRYFARRALGWAQDFDDLVCTDGRRR